MIILPVEIVLVEVSVKPTNEEVVDQRKNPSSANGVVSTDVGENCDLAGKGDLAADELSEQLRERAASDPVSDGVEKQLITAISILFPSSKLVVHSKRDTFLETIASWPGAETNDVVVTLQTKRHVKVFRDVTL